MLLSGRAEKSHGGGPRGVRLLPFRVSEPSFPLSRQYVFLGMCQRAKPFYQSRPAMLRWTLHGDTRFISEQQHYIGCLPAGNTYRPKIPMIHRDVWRRFFPAGPEPSGDLHPLGWAPGQRRSAAALAAVRPFGGVCRVQGCEPSHDLASGDSVPLLLTFLSERQGTVRPDEGTKPLSVSTGFWIPAIWKV